jgi:ubiquinone/menaquinone biosynthesis C-methylase UbiE
MDSVDRFTTKAERYARYRYGYAVEAIQAIFDITGLNSHAVVADVGAGTGLLAKELVDRVEKIYAVEPNLAMREFAERLLGQHPTFIGVDGRSDATTLPDHSLDLIVAGQAIHWFEPQTTLKEFQRILKPEGWLAAVFHTPMRLQSFRDAINVVCTPENGWDTTPTPRPQYGDSHTDFYFGIGNGMKMHFPQTFQENWDAFIGGMLSDSHSPDDIHPAFPRLVAALREVFDQYSEGGYLQVPGGTDIVIGRLRKEAV